MKKFLIGTALVIFLLFTALYLTVNSPYVIDKLAGKYLPRYHIDYEKIRGNPLKGIEIDNPSYRGKRLASRIKVRINPYTLLKKTLTLSQLQVLDVNVSALEEMIKEFTAPSEGQSEEETESSGFSLPLNIELEDIRLTLLPFDRYGIHVSKEELSIDSIYYDGERFNVGTLNQLAETSIGQVAFEGTYHKRFLDVRYLNVDGLDMTRLEHLIAYLGSQEPTAASSTKKVEPSSENNVTAAPASEDIFLPKRIHAGKVRLSMRPYDVMKGVHLQKTAVEGQGLDVDLEHLRIREGAMRAELQSNLAQIRLKLHAKKGRLILDNGTVSDLDANGMIALAGSKETEKNATATARPAPETHPTPAKKTALDSLPFVPRTIEIRQLQLKLKPEEIEGLSIRSATAKIENAKLDLHEERALAKLLEASIDTPLAHTALKASLEPKLVHIENFALSDVDLERIRQWLKRFQKPKASAATQKVSDNAPISPKEKGAVSKGLKLPFLPSTLLVDQASVETKPFHLEPLQTRRSRIELEQMYVDLTQLLAKSGKLHARIESNLADMELTGVIKENRLLLNPPGKNRILLAKSLFSTYRLPLRAEAFSPIVLSGTADAENVILQASFHAEKILADRNSSFNVDINRSVTQFHFNLAKGRFSVSNDANLSTPYAPLKLHAELKPGTRGALGYRGYLETPGVELGDPKIQKLLGAPRIDFAGDLHSVLAKLDAGALQGSFVSRDFKKGLLKLESKAPIRLARYIKLPPKLQGAQLSLDLRTPVDFAKPLPLDTAIKLHSNVANLDAHLLYDGNVTLSALTRFPKDSLLKKALPNLNLSALDPLKLKGKMDKRVIKLSLASKAIKADVEYDTAAEKIAGLIDLAGSKIKVAGNPKETITATLLTPSVKTLTKKLTAIYRVEIPKLDGDLKMKLKIEKLSKASLELKSKQFVPDDNARIKAPIKNIDIVLGADVKNKTLIIKKYSLETAGMKIFATKPSRIRMAKDRIVIDAFWVNDSLKVTGAYDLKKKEGEIVAKAARFKVIHENAKFDAAIDIKTKINGDKIDTKGTVTILGGNVMYDLQAKHYATDEDIIIVQHQKKNEESFFRKNVQITLFIKTKKPLFFKQKDVFVEIRPQLSVIKPYNGDLQLLGSVKLAKNGYYIFEGKKFVLEESSVNFTGKPTQPLLDINLVYRRYSKTIYIRVNGVATEPNINFSSDPYMTQSQILSFILFDTEDTGNNAEDMMSMVGGGIAKSILGNIGLKVDTLIVTTAGFEVGKKITKRITILYDQRSLEPKVIVRIKHSEHTQTDISIGSESQSVDIIYKREF